MKLARKNESFSAASERIATTTPTTNVCYGERTVSTAATKVNSVLQLQSNMILESEDNTTAQGNKNLTAKRDVICGSSPNLSNSGVHLSQTNRGDYPMTSAMSSFNKPAPTEFQNYNNCEPSQSAYFGREQVQPMNSSLCKPGSAAPMMNSWSGASGAPQATSDTGQQHFNFRAGNQSFSNNAIIPQNLQPNLPFPQSPYQRRVPPYMDGGQGMRLPPQQQCTNVGNYQNVPPQNFRFPMKGGNNVRILPDPASEMQPGTVLDAGMDGGSQPAFQNKTIGAAEESRTSGSGICMSPVSDYEMESNAANVPSAKPSDDQQDSSETKLNAEDSCSRDAVTSSTTFQDNEGSVADSSTSVKAHKVRRSDKQCGATAVFSKIASMGEEPDRTYFLEQLFNFMNYRGTPISVLPVICRTTVDLYKLYHIVKEFNGMVEVTKAKQWRDVSTAMGLGGSSSAGFTLKRNYGRYLFPYECKFDRNDVDPDPLLAAMETPSRKDSKKKAVDKEAGLDNSQPLPDQPEIQQNECFPTQPQGPHTGINSGMMSNCLPTNDTGMMVPGCPPGGMRMGNQIRMGQPAGMMGQPQGMMGQPVGMMGQPQGMMGQPQGMMGQPQGMMGQPQGMMGQPQGMMGQPQGMMGQPQGMMGQPQGMMGQPQGIMGQPQGMVAPDGFSHLPSNHNMPNSFQDMSSAASSGLPVHRAASGYPVVNDSTANLSSSVSSNQPIADHKVEAFQESQNSLGQSIRGSEHPHLVPQPHQSGFPNIPQTNPNLQNLNPPFSLQNMNSRFQQPAGVPQQNIRYNGCLVGAVVKPDGMPFQHGGMIRPPHLNQTAQLLGQKDPQFELKQDHSKPYTVVMQDDLPKIASVSGQPHLTGMNAGGIATSNALHSSIGAQFSKSSSTQSAVAAAAQSVAMVTRQLQLQKAEAACQSAVSLKRDITFPEGSVEATKPRAVRKRKLKHRDLGTVDMWRVMMALRSGQIAESTWALDVLSVLIYDDSTASAFSLSGLLGLLETLVEHMRRSLISVFGKEFEDLETTASVEIGPDLRAMNILEADEETNCKEPRKFIPPTSHVVKTKNGNKRVRLEFVTDTDGCFEDVFLSRDCVQASKVDWSSGNGHSTNHIVTSFLPDNSSNFESKQFFGKSVTHISSDKSDRLPASKVCNAKHGNQLESGEGIVKQEPCTDKTNDSSWNASSNEVGMDSLPLVAIEDCSSKNERKVNPNQLNSWLDERLFGNLNGLPFSFSQMDSIQGSNSEANEEVFEPDVSPFCQLTASQLELSRRCICISNILRNLALVSGNENEMSKHGGLMRLLAQLSLLHHKHRPPHQTNRSNRLENCLSAACDVVDPQPDSQEECEPSSHEWWWETLIHLRENSLVILACISGHLDLAVFPQEICFPLLEGLLHWSICRSAEALDPHNGSAISLQRIVLEALCKLCVKRSNVDLLIATPPFSRIVHFLVTLVELTGDRHTQVVREFALGLLSHVVQADSSVARALALERQTVCLLLEFIEDVERQARLVSNMHGVEALQDNPEMIGTSVDMVCRAADILRHLALVAENGPILARYRSRLLQLVMSQILDCRVTAILAEVLGASC